MYMDELVYPNLSFLSQRDVQIIVIYKMTFFFPPSRYIFKSKTVVFKVGFDIRAELFVFF